MDSSYLMELSNIYNKELQKIMELELTKVQLKKEITKAKERVNYLDVELKRITSKDRELDSYCSVNDTNFKKLSEDIDYSTIEGLRIEARQKLNDIKPISIGQASRISGVSPADISVLLIYLEQMRRTRGGNNE